MQCGACNAPDNFIARLDLCLVMLLGACSVPLHLPSFLTHPNFKLSILLAKCNLPVILDPRCWRSNHCKPAYLFTATNVSGMHTDAGISPETAAGNDPSSLGYPPPVTPQGSDAPVPGQASINSLPIRATSPAIAGGAATSTAGR